MSNTFVRDMNSDLQLEIKVVMSLCESVDTPRSLAVYLLLRYGEYEQYMDLSIQASNYDNPSNFADDHLVTEVLRKSPNLPIDADKVEAAHESFWVSELSCFATNLRLREQTFEFEHKVRDSIARILGPLSKSALNLIESNFGHGPGATASLRGYGIVPSDKFDNKVSLTVELYPYYKSILGPNWWNTNKLPADIVSGNKFTTVPKNARTNRGICAEPTLNMYVQRGIGKYMRNRLRLFGIDLTDQSQNQRMAKRAYSEGLATIDLSSASDSLSTELVLSYFPQDWVDLLTLCRSDFCHIDGDQHELEKFSSMGNGYTFELETLVFYSVCMSVIPKEEMDRVGVYGDDIIVPAKYASRVIEVLNFLGFRTNQRKSFLAGNFFESCGTDWFKGQNVRPFYLKGRKRAIPYALQICNAIRKYSHNRLDGAGCDSRFRQLWVELYNSLPNVWKRCRVPLSFGDSGIITSFLEAKPPRAKNQLQGYIARHIVFRNVNRDKRTHSVLLSNLAQAMHPESSTQGREPRRGYLGRIRPKK